MKNSILTPILHRCGKLLELEDDQALALVAIGWSNTVEHGEELSLEELSRRTGIPRRQLRRTLTALEQRGYIINTRRDIRLHQSNIIREALYARYIEELLK